MIMAKQSALKEYIPTPEQRRRWAREAREAAKFHVSYYQVVHEERIGGRATCTFPISPPYSTPEKARAALRRLKSGHPTARILHGTWFYSKDRPADVRARREFLKELE